MENHRLKPMQSGYDEKLFNELYQSTENLRNMLVRQINPRRFGVTQDIIKSWFDDKFIFVFNRYYGSVDNGKLKGYIINSLKTFKYRVLRNAYTKSNPYNDSIYIEDYENMINIIPLEEDREDNKELLNMVMSFIKARVTPDAYLIMDIDLNPPPYIANKLNSSKTKIPAKLVAEYLDMELNDSSIGYINNLRSEVKDTILIAKEYFRDQVPI